MRSTEQHENALPLHLHGICMTMVAKGPHMFSNFSETALGTLHCPLHGPDIQIETIGIVERLVDFAFGEDVHDVIVEWGE